MSYILGNSQANFQKKMSQTNEQSLCNYSQEINNALFTL